MLNMTATVTETCTLCCRYLDILENIEGRVQRYYHKREPRQLIPQLVPNDSLNSIVRSQDRCSHMTFTCSFAILSLTVVTR